MWQALGSARFIASGEKEILLGEMRDCPAGPGRGRDERSPACDHYFDAIVRAARNRCALSVSHARTSPTTASAHISQVFTRGFFAVLR